MRFFLAILLGRFVGGLSRLVGRGGSALPGLVAEKVDPRLVEKILGGTPVVLITGTNGKTTTTKMIVAVLEHAGRRVVTNPTGSNLGRGVASALLASSSLRGRLDADVAVFEVDEAAVRSLAPRLKPSVLVVTNLVRDQLDRYGELQTTASHVASAATHAGRLVLNADDPLVAGAAGDRPVSWFGGASAIRERMPDDRSLHGDGPAESSRPAAEALVVDSSPDGDGQVASLRIDGAERRIRLQVPGVYNAYNAAAALLAAGLLGVGATESVAALEDMAPAFGRGQVLEYRGRRVKILLVKNPASLNQAIELLRGVSPSAVLVAINDEHADGRDVSWLWDAGVERLADSAHRFGAGGVRAADMALRFKYAGIGAWVEEVFAEALGRLVADAAEGETVYLVPTYTAMLRFLEILDPKSSRSEAWR
ncbi:MAG: MurT ligase domain-containing protein [Acidimicrobiia bacterium]